MEFATGNIQFWFLRQRENHSYYNWHDATTVYLKYIRYVWANSHAFLPALEEKDNSMVHLKRNSHIWPV